MKFFSLVTGCVLLLSASILRGTATATAAPTTQPAVSFTRDIQPIISDACYSCHGPDTSKRKADLRFDRLDPKLGPFAPRDGYRIISPGDLDNSVMIMRITSDDPDVHMPPPNSNRKLSDGQIDLIKQWVKQGAKWGKIWSLVPPVRPPLPAVKNSSWVRNPIDQFLLADMEREGLQPSPEAPKERLIRRVTLDLTGLPPTLAEIDAFLADTSPDAYEKVVDRLLASPRYGERMAWDWLDLARYADTNGYQADPTRTMWPWRDWVIRALNANMPYDQFATWQLAGDLLPNATQEQQLASGFNRNHPYNGEGGRIAEETRVENVLDRTDTMGTAFLGTTVGCAKCHDHKYDPISQKEYYQLSAYFNRCSEDGSLNYVGEGNVPPVMILKTPEQEKRLAELKSAAKAAADKLAAATPQIDRQQADWEKLELLAQDSVGFSPVPIRKSNLLATLTLPANKRSAATNQKIQSFYRLHFASQFQPLLDASSAATKVATDYENALPHVMVMNDVVQRQAHILIKGNYDNPSEKVESGVPEALNPMPAGAPNNRLGLAKWLFDPANPLTARVTVNRYWQQFFGYGIVKTVDDFGVQGERPVHPELLDWLAVQFRESGWDTKAIRRLIVTSAAYRQSSKVSAELVEKDPENRLIARGPRFRMSSPMIRDQALAASGLLVEQIGGPPVKPYQPPGIWEEATFGKITYVQDHGDALYRRSIYTFWRRIVGPTEFFDTASRSQCTVRPQRTNTPLHALTTLNDTTYVEAARVLAQRVMLAKNTPTERMEMAYRLLLSRKPEPDEMNVLLAAVTRLQSEYANDKDAATKLLSVGESKRDQKLDPAEHAAYTAVCLEIMNLDEALTKE